jgi:hypothetical protein
MISFDKEKGFAIPFFTAPVLKIQRLQIPAGRKSGNDGFFPVFLHSLFHFLLGQNFL